ncbi:MAG: leucyl/phenylalanyl-tRNA--protein transferase [Candidatus Hydrogenedentes bacterium]|nr:leucyl/phenylalanyl-tRNA--protein transferase [Candidatus Hydrogenedentota bacterium]
MPIFRLSDALVFPPPDLAEEGLLAVGGDLSVERLLLAYEMGIFPWYSEGEPILWWSPDPRMVIRPKHLHISHRFARTLRQGRFRVTLDRAFPLVIRHCATTPRPGQRGTWITPEMEAAYVRLHEAGYAHSAECWQGDRLVGGIYGVSLGAIFFGESMFSQVSDGSKVAITRLLQQMDRWHMPLLDCQVANPHLRRLGGVELPRAAFLDEIHRLQQAPTRCGRWTLDADLC